MSDSNINTSSQSAVLKVLKWSLRYWHVYLILSILTIAMAFLPVLWAESMRRLFNVAASGTFDDLRTASLFLGGVFALEIGGEMLRSIMIQKQANRSTLEFQKAILDRLFFVRLVKYARWHTGDKIQRINDSAIEVQNGVNTRIPTFIGQILEVSFLLIYLTNISIPLAVGAFSVGLLLPLCSNMFGKKIKAYQQHKNEAQSLQDTLLMDILQGQEVVRSYGLHEKLFEKWRIKTAVTRQKGLRLYFWQLLSEWSGWIGFWLGQIYILAVGAWLVSTRNLEIGIIAAFMISYERLVFPLGGLVNQWAVFQNTFAHAERVIEMVDPTEPAPKSEWLLEANTTHPIDTIEFKNVNFRYSEEQELALNCFSAAFPKGKVTALVGPSGSGKSTVFKILLGLYPAESGEVLFNNERSTKVDYRSVISYMPQQPYFFEGSLRHNLTMGMESVSDEALDEACAFASATEVVSRLPYRYETLIQDRGSNFSGGEQQRLSIARAYLRRPQIILLDEPTASLDYGNERQIQQALKSLYGNLTVIIIAHRLSTVIDADQILFMTDGNVVERGTHRELMKRNGAYADMITQNEWLTSEEEVKLDEPATS